MILLSELWGNIGGPGTQVQVYGNLHSNMVNLATMSCMVTNETLCLKQVLL